MPLLLMDRVAGRTIVDDTVEIAIIDYWSPESAAATQRFWYIYSSSPTGSPMGEPAAMIFREASVPLVVRQLYAVLKWYGADMLYDAKLDVYTMLGPHLLRPLDAHFRVKICILGENISTAYLRQFEPVPQPTDAAKLTRIWSHFQWIFNLLLNDDYRPIARGFRAARRWRQVVAAGPKKRALARTDAIHEELIAAAWHPRRMVKWCMDCDEQREFGEMRA